MDRENQAFIAKKYAKAFLKLFSSTLNLQIPEDIYKIRTFISYLHDHRDSLFYADLKLLSVEKRQTILHNLIDKFNLPSLIKKLTDLLVLHQRVFLLDDILKSILKLYLDTNKITLFEVYSSHPLSPEHQEAFVQFLASKSNKNVIINSHLDPHLIAGLKAISTEFEWEHSIRKKLSLLNQT